MSRIHEALKRAELERASGQNGQRNNGQMETGPATAVVAPQLDQPAFSGAHVSPEVDPGTLQFEAMWSKCTRKEWDPDPKVIVFKSEDPHYPGAEQFRTLRSRLY